MKLQNCTPEQRQQVAFARLVATAEAAGVTLQRGWVTEIRAYSSAHRVGFRLPTGHFFKGVQAALQRLGVPRSRLRKAPSCTTASELRWAAEVSREHGLQMRGIVDRGDAAERATRRRSPGSAKAQSLAHEGAPSDNQ